MATQFPPLDHAPGLSLLDQQAIWDGEAAHLCVRNLRGAASTAEPLNWKLIVAGPLLALLWLLVTT